MTFSSFMMMFKFSLISKKIEMDLSFQGLYQLNKTKTDTTNTMTTTAMTLTELRMKNNNPSRFLKQDDIELIVSLFENASSHAEFEAELRKKFEKKCDICEVGRDLETGECDCRIVECAGCGEKHPKYEMNLVEGVCGLRCDECDPTRSTSCYECGECLDDPATHIFCFSKEGEEDRTLCCECGQDFHKEYKSEGWTRDDESMLGSDDEEEEEEEDTCECCGKPYDDRSNHYLWELCDCVQNDDGTLSRPKEEDEESIPDVKDCGHFFDCGCGMTVCGECDEDMCDNEACAIYYTYRNDACMCDGCDFCEWKIRIRKSGLKLTPPFIPE